ncbi:DUF3616 domain-containing protein [Rhizobium redzepovicii]|uniref:DUF3616 domain-containing protein n=1 Tax=Rhizobium redzepovicii TaxID=2867518 RepID=UPI002871AFE3|nr:DUF3616 domain-containing protein [Rhizobium redzepovicii]MDR9781129.1 DUF3616 domain-containing protein [Rhizobium redzepovicii]
MNSKSWVSLGIVVFGTTSLAAQNAPTSYKGLCEASAGVYIDDNHFVVASDETNVLRLYVRGDPSIGIALDFQGASGFDKSDIEAAAKVGDTVYWISSHSLNSNGEDKKKRKIFFATKIVTRNGSTTLEWGGSFLLLRDEILGVAGIQKSDLNIEGMAAAPDGGLFIGLRDTLGGKALIIPFKNPSEVIEYPDKKPSLGTPFTLALAGKGVRGIEQTESGYLIVAGPVSDEGDFSLYRWPGGAKPAVEVEDVNFAPLRPEAIMRVPGKNIMQVLSDDGGEDCDDEVSPVTKRAFRSRDLEIND